MNCLEKIVNWESKLEVINIVIVELPDEKQPFVVVEILKLHTKVMINFGEVSKN